MRRSLSEALRDWTALAPPDELDDALLPQPARTSMKLMTRAMAAVKSFLFFNLFSSNQGLLQNGQGQIFF